MGKVPPVGLDVTTADNGELACAAVAGAAEQQRPFDLVLMDIQMPVLDGHGAAERLRREGFALPIVALTAHATEHDRERCLLAGFEEVFALAGPGAAAAHSGASAGAGSSGPVASS